MTTRFNVHYISILHTRFFELLVLLNEGFLEEPWFWVAFGGFGVAKLRLPAHIYMYGSAHIYDQNRGPYIATTVIDREPWDHRFGR